jgi:hypothetical protein
MVAHIYLIWQFYVVDSRLRLFRRKGRTTGRAKIERNRRYFIELSSYKELSFHS